MESQTLHPNIPSVSPESDTSTDLIRAIRRRDELQVVSDLISSKADVNAKDPNGNTVLSLAVRAGDYSLISRLLEDDSLQVKDTDALTELVLARLPFDEKVVILHELVFRRVDLNRRNSAGQGVLEFCKQTKQYDLGHLLHELGATVSDVKVKLPELPDSPSQASLLEEPLSPLQLQSPVHVKEDIFDIGQTAKRLGDLFAELEGARASVVNMEACVSARSSPSGVAPVSHRMTEAELVAQKMELLNKLNMYLVDFEKAKGGKDFMAIRNLMEIQKVIADTRAEITEITARITDGDFDAAPVSDDRSEEEQDPVGWFRSPESIEADVEVCMRQIRKSSGVLINFEGSIFDIIQRCQSHHVIPALKLLRNRGADVNFREASSGLTSLMIACDADREDLVDWLVGVNALTSLPLIDRKLGWTALHYAVKSGNKRVCDLLLSKFGGDKVGVIAVVDKEGRTARDLCTNAAIAKLLNTVGDPAQSS
jgi:ankyrin repeat protein